MRDYDVFKKWLGGVLDLMWGTPNMFQKALKKEMMKKPKRARGKKGRYLADDPTTKGINEAWVGGKAPKKGKK
tara:strand:- start:358 stop:576 length:219 start_codon:yes stop_codon:yes gene_type:complete